jgi:MFS transporter, PPP family, 3-phenylpropionic acid transporter
VLSLAAVALSVWNLPDLKESVPALEPRPPILPVLQKRTVQWFFAAVFFHVLSHMGLYMFFSLYLDALGYSKSAIGLLWAVSVVVEIICFFTQSRWLPLMSLTGWLLLCGAVMVLRMGLTASSAALWPLLLLAQCLHAFTFAAHHTVCTALLSHHFPGKLRGRGQALYAVLGYGLTGVLGGLVGGLMSAHLGLASVFWVTLGTSVIATACAWQVWRLRHRLHLD